MYKKFYFPNAGFTIYILMLWVRTTGLLTRLVLPGVTGASAPSWLLSNFSCFWKYLICSKELQGVLHPSLKETRNTRCQCPNWRLLHDVLRRIKRALKLGKLSLQEMKAQIQNSLFYIVYRTYTVLYFKHWAMFKCTGSILELKNPPVWNVLTYFIRFLLGLFNTRCPKGWGRGTPCQ